MSQPEILSAAVHSKLKLGSINNWKDVQIPRWFPVTASEAIYLAAVLPIIFVNISGFMQCVTLLRIKSQRSSFISREGAWTLPLLPPQMVLEPFGTRAMSDGRFALTIDLKSPAWSNDGVPLFDENDCPSAHVVRISKIMARRYADLRQTRRVCSTLANSGLMQPLSICGESGFFAVPAETVPSAKDYEALKQSSAERLLLAQQISLVHLNTLCKQEAFPDYVATEPRRNIADQNRRVDFIKCMTSMHRDDENLYSRIDLLND